MGKILCFAFAGTAFLFLMVAFYRSDPIHETILPPCPLHERFGLYCAGCGGTRAAHLLLHARIPESLRYNPLVLLLAVFLAVLSARTCFRVRSGFAPRGFCVDSRYALHVLVVLCAFTVLRNIPCRPFIWLVPPPSTSATTHRGHGEVNR